MEFISSDFMEASAEELGILAAILEREAVSASDCV